MIVISRENIKKIFNGLLFAASFGYLEASVVVYLRELYYPSGFNISQEISFPFIKFGMVSVLQNVPLKILFTEIGREASTLIILFAVSILSVKKWRQRCGFFLYLFAAWDLAYYFFLKMLSNWPESLSTLDVLFLIPVPWVAPVWLPISASFIMLIAAFLLIKEPSYSDL